MGVILASPIMWLFVTFFPVFSASAIIVRGRAMKRNMVYPPAFWILYLLIWIVAYILMGVIFHELGWG